MITTIEEAREQRYGRSTAHPSGARYREGYCLVEITSKNRWNSRQCSRKNGFGPGGLYCKQHAKWIEKWEGGE